MNIIINDYASTEKVGTLCSEIDMPVEVSKKIAYFIENTDFTPINSQFGGLFNMETAKEASESIEAFCKDDHIGIKAMSVYLMAALHTKEIYKAKGISNTIYVDTFKAFSRFVNEYMESNQVYGFDRGFWTFRQLSAVLFRLGVLEYEMKELDKPIMSEDITAGATDVTRIREQVLSVHIPSDAVMTREDLDQSYKMAVDFFANYYKGFSYKCIYCSTWLLSPVLKDLLPAGSKILNFQEDYNIIRYYEDDNSYLRWVYKKQYDDLNDLPENTTLARNIKKYILSGGKIGSALGILHHSS